MYRVRDNGQLDGRDREWLTPEQAATARRLILEGATQQEAAEAIGISYRRLRARLEDQLADVRVGRGRVRRGIKHERFRDLHPDEIWVRAFEIRRSWPLERWTLPHQDRPIRSDL